MYRSLHEREDLMSMILKELEPLIKRVEELEAKQAKLEKKPEPKPHRWNKALSSPQGGR